jgi:hypothetical protein
MSQLIVTDNAAERWAQRIEPGSSFEQARARIYDLFSDAARLDQRSVNGDEIWKTSDPVAGLVAKREQGKVVIVTVLTADRIGCVEEPDEEEEQDELSRRRSMKLRIDVVWRHHSGDRRVTEEELRRFLLNRFAALNEKGTGKATIERIVIE